MNSINKILCPTDFSDAAINAVEFSAELSRDLNASLTLWNMYEIDSLKDEQSSFNRADKWPKQKEENFQILKDWCEQVREEYGVNCGFSLEENGNSLPSTLSHFFENENFNLIVSGTNGVDVLLKHFFGTNSYNIVKKKLCPVLIVPENCVYDGISNLLFLSNYLTSDVGYIKMLLTLFKTKIEVLHISKHDTQVSEDVFHSFSSRMDEGTNFDNRVRFHRIVNDSILDGLFAFIASHTPSLIVVTAAQRNVLDIFFHKSFTKELVERINSPVLVLN